MAENNVVVDLGPIGAKVWELLGVLYDTDQDREAWLKAPQLLLNDRVPLAMLLKGEGEAVRDVLQAVCDGAYL